MEDKGDSPEKAEKVLGRGSIVCQESVLRKSMEHGRFEKLKKVRRAYEREHCVNMNRRRRDLDHVAFA